MKKTIYGLIVAALGAVIGVGGAYFFGLNKPAAPGAVNATAAAASAPAKPADGSKAPDGAAKAGDAPKAAGGAPGAPGGPSPVEMGKPEKLNWPTSVTAVGSLRSDESVIIRSEQSGRIVKLNFVEGQPVKKGQLLVQLDDGVTRAELGQANANLKLAKAKFDRAVELNEKKFISGQAKDEAENALRVAEAAVKLIEARLGRFNIEAPFSGTVGLRTAGVGDYIKDGQDIVNLEKTDPIKVDFKVPELFQSKVRVGQSLAVTLDAIPGKPFVGTVFAVNPQLDTAGRAVVLRAQMPNRDAALKPGMFARVRLTLSDIGETIVVPEQAVSMQGEDQVMFKVVDGRAIRTKVEVGQRREGKVEILQGIAATDTVVIAGQQRLRDGAAVRPAGGGALGGGNAAGNGAGATKGPPDGASKPVDGLTKPMSDPAKPKSNEEKKP
jgi:membrane fusion protein, multidrug efflux system